MVEQRATRQNVKEGIRGGGWEGSRRYRRGRGVLGKAGGTDGLDGWLGNTDRQDGLGRTRLARQDGLGRTDSAGWAWQDGLGRIRGTGSGNGLGKGLGSAGRAAEERKASPQAGSKLSRGEQKQRGEGPLLMLSTDANYMRKHDIIHQHSTNQKQEPPTIRVTMKTTTTAATHTTRPDRSPDQSPIRTRPITRPALAMPPRLIPRTDRITLHTTTPPPATPPATLPYPATRPGP